MTDYESERLATKAEKEAREARDEARRKEADRMGLTCVAAYIILGFISFGYAWNHPSVDDITQEVPGREIKSVMAGVFWPVWGTGTLAIAVTKWP